MYRQNPSSFIREVSHGGVKPPKAPERPLDAYMRFNRKMFPKIRQDDPDSPMWDVSKKIKQMWQEMSDAERSLYQNEYELERIEYEKIMKIYYNSAAYQQYLVARTRVKPPEKPTGGSARKTGGTNASVGDANYVTGVIIQPVDDEDPFEMTAKRLSAVRFERNNRLMAELFASNYLPDSRNVVPQQRVEQLEKQRLALAKHQQKLNDDLDEIAVASNNRKRSIKESSAAFESELKRVCADRPQPSEERYNSLVDEWQDVLLKSYEEYKKRQAAIKARLEAERRETPVLYSLTCGKSPSPESQHTPKANGIESAKSEATKPEKPDSTTGASGTGATSVAADSTTEPALGAEADPQQSNGGVVADGTLTVDNTMDVSEPPSQNSDAEKTP